MKKWKGYERGVNLGGWLSQCPHTREHYDSFIGEKDLEQISSWGADHVRLPIDYNLVETYEGERIEEGFSYIEKAIDWCGRNHLNMILDLHKTAGYSFDSGEKETGFFDSEKYQERFYALWEELAERYAGYGDRIAFELLNEVTDQKYCEIWNQIADKCIRRIRRIAPTTSILVGGYWNNSVSAVKDIAMPQDENIVYNFHCYDPLIFTHQGAYWAEGMPLDFRYSFRHTVGEIMEDTQRLKPDWLEPIRPVRTQDIPMGPEFFKELFADALRVAEERNVALYCGEYGVIDLADVEESVAWHRAIHQVFEEYSIGRAVWTYRDMNFGFINEPKNQILTELTKYL